MNIFSHNSSIDNETQMNGEEDKIIKETNKILDANIDVYPTCIRVATERCHGEAITIEIKNKVSREDVIETLQTHQSKDKYNLHLDNVDFPDPLNTKGKIKVQISRIRVRNNKIQLWVCGDQLLRGASLNAYEIFETYIKQNEKK